MKRNLLLSLPVAVLFLALGAWFGIRQAESAPPSNDAVSAFLAQELADAEGKTHKLSEWKGKNLVINFWATWCKPCVQEMPELSALQGELKAQNIQVLGIGIDSPSNIVDFTRKVPVAYPLYVAGMGGTELSRKFGNTAGGLPFTVLVGADGKVKKTYMGKLKFDELRRDLKVFQ